MKPLTVIKGNSALAPPTMPSLRPQLTSCINDDRIDWTGLLPFTAAGGLAEAVPAAALLAAGQQRALPGDGRALVAQRLHEGQPVEHVAMPGAVGVATPCRFEQLQIANRGLVEHHRVGFEERTYAEELVQARLERAEMDEEGRD